MFCYIIKVRANQILFSNLIYSYEINEWHLKIKECLLYPMTALLLYKATELMLDHAWLYPRNVMVCIGS